tara:strand:+ start:1876 stop:2481 length:606 start_codon:yes stop_codon:yes gene_type:complete
VSNTIKINDVFINQVISKHLVNEFDWGERMFPIVSLNFHSPITKPQLLPLLRSIIIQRFGSLQDYTLFYAKSTICYVNSNEENVDYLHYNTENRRKFNNSALPYLRPRILIIDMTDITDTGIESDYSKFEWVSKYLYKHKKHSLIQTTVIICTSNLLETDSKGINLNDFLKETSDIVFNIVPLSEDFNINDNYIKTIKDDK